MDPVYGYQAINVEAQERAPFSLLNWMKRMIGLRKQSKVFGRGTIEFLPAQNRKVLAYVRRYEDETVLCVANLARTVQPVELDLSRFKGMTPVEMLGLTEFPRIGEQPYFLTLGPYAFYWFRLQQAPAPLTARVAPETAADVPHAPALLVGAAWETLLDGNVRTLIERDLLLPFLQRQRWFGGKARPARSRGSSTGACSAAPAAALCHDRAGRLRRRRARSLFPAADRLRARRREPARRAIASCDARERNRRAQRPPLRRLA